MTIPSALFALLQHLTLYNVFLHETQIERMLSLIQRVYGSGSNVILNVIFHISYIKYGQVCKHLFS